MSSKQKCDELIEKFTLITNKIGESGFGSMYYAKQCALICVLDEIEILEVLYKDCIDNIIYPVNKNKEGAGRKIENKINELKEIKEEIENL